MMRWVLLTVGGFSGAAFAESLYDAQSFRALAADTRAARVGDVITVHILESSSATSSADTSTLRKNEVRGGAAVSNSLTRFGMTFEAGGTQGGTFEGGGTTQRTNRLLATITVVVQETLPNGDLRIGGEQLLTVNGEQHKVRLEGRLRAQDVSADNVVLSTRVADARILYVGDGDLSDRNKRAWWRVLLDALGL